MMGMLDTLLSIAVVLALVAALVYGLTLGAGMVLAVIQDSWSAFQRGLHGDSVAK